MSARSVIALVSVLGVPWMATAAEVVVEMLDGRVFSPATVMIAMGDTVAWSNVSDHPHTATSGPEGSPDGLFDSGNMDSGAIFRYTFTSSGSFDYFCDYHSGMTGQVIVEAPPAPDVMLSLAKTLAESGVRLEWSGGSAPFDVLRGEAKDASDLAVIDSIASGASDVDAGVLLGPPFLYFYNVR